MKTKLYLMIVSLCVLSNNAAGIETSRPPGPLALTIVLDSAWSNEQEMPTYKSLSRQVISSLRPGDYLELIVAKPGEPGLLLAQYTKSGDATELKNIVSILDGVKCPFLSDEDVYKSVDLALNRLAKSFTINSFDKMAVIVFTDGKLKDSDVTRIVQLSDEFRLRNWPLYITGTYETNKRLLVAANKNKFDFSLVNEANPAVWINSKRGIAVSSQASNRPFSIITSAPTTQASQPQQNVPVTTGVPTTGKSTSGTIVTVPKSEEKPQPVKTVEKTVKPEIKTTPASKVPEPVKTVTKPEPVKPVKEAIDKQDENKSKSKTLFWLIPVIGVLSICVILIYSSYSKSKRWKTGLSSQLNSPAKKEPGTLIAKWNGKTFTLRALRPCQFH